MRNEPAFLFAAVCRFLNSEAPVPLAEKINWTELMRLADAHAVTPMLYAALRETSIPDAVAEALRSACERSVGWSLAQSGELARVAGLFERHGIPMVSLKGPLLSRYLYGDLSVRSSGDIDLLVKREDVLRTRDILVSNGYRATNTLHWDSDSACLRLRGKEMAFDSPSGVSIDVHWRLIPPYFASPFDELDGWESLRTVLLAGQQVQTLAPEPLLLFLCSHGAKHMFERLEWICDIARFLTVTPNLDWTAVLAQARRARALRQVSLSLRLASGLLGTSPPPQLPEDPMVELLARAVRNRLLAGAMPPAPAFESTRFCLRLLEHPGQRLRCLSGQYLTPSEAEYRVMRLPPWLYFLYYPLRPIRLFWKHVIQRPLLRA